MLKTEETRYRRDANNRRESRGPEGMLKTAGPSNSKNVSNRMYATCKNSRDARHSRDANKRREANNGGNARNRRDVNNTAGPQQQHNCIQQLDC
jgi:hypothetical protein